MKSVLSATRIGWISCIIVLFSGLFWLLSIKNKQMESRFTFRSDLSAYESGNLISKDGWKKKLTDEVSREVASGLPRSKYDFRILQGFNANSIYYLLSEISDCGLGEYKIYLNNKCVKFATIDSDYFPELHRNQNKDYINFFENTNIDKCTITYDNKLYDLLRFRVNNENIKKSSDYINKLKAKNLIIWLLVDESVTPENLFEIMNIIKKVTKRPPIWFLK